MAEGLEPASILRTLSEHCRVAVPQNVIYTINSWAGAVTFATLERGVLLLPSGDDGRVLSITPPLVVDEGALHFALDVVAESVA